MTNINDDKCPLNHARELEEESREFGFYWETIDQVLEQIKSECLEVKEASEKDDLTHLQEEIGDILHAAASLAVFCKMDPRQTLQNSVKKYEKRFRAVTQLAKEDGLDTLQNQPYGVLMNYWNQAKIK